MTINELCLIVHKLQVCKIFWGARTINELCVHLEVHKLHVCKGVFFTFKVNGLSSIFFCQIHRVHTGLKSI